MKIKLVAIAKDEAAYLPYWIYHHLHFGFDAIEIHINRCEDNSKDVLNKIIQQFPQVEYKSGDWVDIAPKCVGRVMQYALYAESYWRTKGSGEYTHICFLDIDEFWTPSDFSSSVKSCLKSLPNATSVSFNWLNVMDEKISFAAFNQELKVQPAPTVKSIISLDADIERVQLHLSEFIQNDKFKGHIMPDGRKFKHSMRQRQRLADSETNIDFPFFVLHRMFRTQMEYVSLLYRGNPRGDTPFKMNRPGYITSDKNQRNLEFSATEYRAYLDGYEKFIEKAQLHNDLKGAQTAIYERSEDAILRLEKVARSVNPQHVSGIKRIFSGIEDERVLKALRTLSKKKSVDLFAMRKKLLGFLK